MLVKFCRLCSMMLANYCIGFSYDDLTWKRFQIIAVAISIGFVGMLACGCTICIYYQCKRLDKKRKGKTTETDANNIIKFEFVKFNEVQNVFNTRECAICLEHFENKSLVTQFKACSHIFHKECMLTFQNMKVPEAIKRRCPLCKIELNCKENYI